LQANSNWLYNVPWGMYKAVMYIKERYGNPTIILSENGMSYLSMSFFFLS
jgi:beta-glucosidase